MLYPIELWVRVVIQDLPNFESDLAARRSRFTEFRKFSCDNQVFRDCPIHKTKRIIRGVGVFFREEALQIE
jgi:hypothetical protein